MFIPVGTDAPLYHRPVATVGLIVTNVGVFIASCWLSGAIFGIGTVGHGFEETPTIGQKLVSFFCLNFGTINPLQWLTANFMHADPIHLIGNMIFLWSFGLIVEGKVGWWKFLAIYLSIGIAQSGFEQIATFPFLSEGGSLGASSAIFGLLAICIVWAPQNEFNIVFLWSWFYAATFEMSVLAFGSFMLFMEIMEVALSGLTITSGLLHLMGAVPGFAIGFGMLVFRFVDCEGYDLIAVYKGEEGERKTISRDEEKRLAQIAEVQQQEQAQAYAEGMAWIDQYLSKGLHQGALGRFQALRRAVPGVKWKKEHLYEVIRGFHGEKKYVETIPLMNEYIDLFPNEAGPMQLKLAQIYLVHAERPHKALHIAQAIPDDRLFQEQLAMRKKLINAAKRKIEDGAIDLED